MYAIIKHGGKQYKVVPDEEVVLEKIDAVKGEKVDLGKLGKVLFISDNGQIKTASSDLDKVKVNGTIVEHFQGSKVIAFKYKSKKNYRRKKGHRQLQTRVMVESIGAAKAKSKKSDEEKPKKPAPKKTAASSAKKKTEAK